MFDEAMAAAVEAAQKRLMNTADRGSVLMSVSDDLSELSRLVEKLDPSKINFDKGGLHRVRAIQYWNRFEEAYPVMKSLFEKLGRSKNILYNSIKTMQRQRDDYMKAYEKFRAVPMEAQDEGYVQQAMVSEDMSVLLQTTVSEHEAMYEYLTNVLKVLEESMDMSVFFAKRKFGRSFEEDGSAKRAFSLEVSDISFQNQYRRLQDTMSAK